MTRRLTVQVDPAAVPMAAVIRTAARGAPLLVLTGRAFGDLASELGGFGAGVGELLSRPIAVNMPTSGDTSSTVFLAPPAWSQERLSGWIGGHHAELEAQFGQVTRLGPNRAERRRRQRGAG